ncbi:3,4-dihydroxy-2-butanone-4-phosphate synthase [Streptomyces palmae]|uniref:3,4-dihydroxy-2-butanone-4-phosphate synthase n=1 Tax=Streptomyces palmae TaxID=1701085 RepID=A0A4Z0H9T0_9ACTN|nr:3,4-dihydroxy-2-butanone-4-phosphate synthase [Streptomyces palmae]TGB05545.1 3,4-dihydroxy-2-butanone-4-phosphate synthase [Streptomyces palmae]
MTVVDHRVGNERILAVERAIETFTEGGFAIVLDGGAPESGHLMVAAEYTDEGVLTRMLDLASGVIRVALPDERAAELRLPQMAEEYPEPQEAEFSVSAGLAAGGATGVSATERSSRTVRALADPGTAARDLARPGQVFPIAAAPGGVLQRDGHTEAAVDLSRLAGLSGVTAMCEIAHQDWSTARSDGLGRLSDSHLIPLVSACDLATYRLARAAHRFALAG